MLYFRCNIILLKREKLNSNTEFVARHLMLIFRMLVWGEQQMNFLNKRNGRQEKYKADRLGICVAKLNTVMFMYRDIKIHNRRTEELPPEARVPQMAFVVCAVRTALARNLNIH